MNLFCQDRDLLAVEPLVFLGSRPRTQQLDVGVGSSSGTTFTATGHNFVAAGVQGGMVLTVYVNAPSEGSACEIVSVLSPTQLCVSVLRADSSDDAVAPPPFSGSFFIQTYRPQIQAVSSTLAEKLRMMAELHGIKSADFADSAQLRQAAVMGTLSSVYLAWADSGRSDGQWIKSEHYRQEFSRLQSQLRIASDADGDGTAERTRALGNVTLRRC